MVVDFLHCPSIASIGLNIVMMTMHHICDAGDLMECIPNGRECLLEDQSREGCVVFFACQGTNTNSSTDSPAFFPFNILPFEI